MKTPEEMARERYHTDRVGDEAIDVNLQRQAYITGYQAAQPQWISVKDRLPEMNDLCLVSTQFERVRIAQYRWESWLFDDGFSAVQQLLNYVTHWMPLPKPPKDEA
jgi:hypothetical protein